MRGTPSNPFRFPLALILLGALLAPACGHKTVVKPPVSAAPPPAPPVARTDTRREPTPVPVIPPATTPPVPITAAGRPPAFPGIRDVPTRGPMIRISLTVQADELRISSEGQFFLVEKTPETPRHALTGQVRVRRENPLKEGREIYRVQVASLSNREAAEKLGRQLSDQFSVPSVTRENAATGTNQVRIGRFESRKEAQDFLSGALAEAGYRDAFVVREAGETANGESTLALRGPNDLFRLSPSGYLFLPGSDTNFLRLNGQPYRGVLDVSLGGNGRVTVINQLGVEEYLRGVVPRELSPVSYPDPEALAAQAIAARTYALKNLGKNRADGFDLFDDIRSQVYGGVTAEKDAASDAVQRTAGIAIYYDGSLIDAMYTSTCGGRTEDSSLVFDSQPVPYLRSVFCTVESGSEEVQEANLQGVHDLDQVMYADDGRPANREFELAFVLGLTGSVRLTQESVAATPDAAEIRGWLARARALTGKSGVESSAHSADPTSRAGFLQVAAESFFGAREIEMRVSESDVSYYLGNLNDGSDVPAAARHALAYLAQRKLWRPYPDNTVRPGRAIQRGDALALLTRWILAERPEVLKTGVSAEPAGRDPGENGNDVLLVKRGNRTERIRLAPDLRLFKLAGGGSMPVAQLRLIGNEKLVFHQKQNGEIDFLEVELSATGASSDRFSPLASWRVTISRAVVAEKLRSFSGNLGELRDIRPARLGNSGRVVQLEIIGSRGSAVVNGYRARNALGLRDTLYTLSRTLADDGTVASFTFDGRGWGHGVGLCQTGAVGMARAGKSAEEILKTYYQGVELRKAY